MTKGISTKKFYERVGAIAGQYEGTGNFTDFPRITTEESPFSSDNNDDLFADFEDWED